MIRKSFAVSVAGAVVAVLIYMTYVSPRLPPPSEDGGASADSTRQQQPQSASDSESEVQTAVKSVEPEEEEVFADSLEPEPYEEPNQVARSNPFNLRSEIEKEPIDPVWAPMAQKQIRTHLETVLAEKVKLRERYSLTTVRCRSTLCEAVFLDYGPDPDASDFQGNLHLLDLELFDQPWFAQFDKSTAKMLYMSGSGLLEQHLFLRRED